MVIRTSDVDKSIPNSRMNVCVCVYVCVCIYVCVCVIRYLPYYDWLVWMDSDTVITNYTVKLEWFLQPDSAIDTDTNLILTDHNIALNNGVVCRRYS